MNASLDLFAENVLHCVKTQCPFHQCRPGGYPKFSYGNARSRVVAVFQNPGQPTCQEKFKTIETVTVGEMRLWANIGVSHWLNTNLDDASVLEYDGRSFLDAYYITQAYRCPDPLDQEIQGQRKSAMRHCSDHLRQEFHIIKPRVVLAFGREALESVKNILLSSGSRIDLKIKMLFSEKKILEWSGIRVFPLVHPSGYWRKPSMKKGEYIDTIRWYISQIGSR